ncbi:MAG TPA: HAD family hydrolase [Alphaproteobacteria bacterium]|nr:HAD family hydrolase [Alphaproteobacteria bacterium]
MKKIDYSKPLTPDCATPHPDAIFFDWDGTLVDGLPLVMAGYHHLASSFQVPDFSVEDIKKFMRRSARELFPELFGKRAADAQKAYYDFVMREHINFFSPLDGAEDFLREMNRNNVPLAVISNRRHDLLVLEIKERGWDIYFSSIVGAGQAAFDKPKADPLLLARDEAGLTSTDVIWYVGDSETDMVAALAAGMVPVFVEGGMRRLSDCHNIGIYHHSFACVRDIHL